jgi:hypothetical protein
VIDSRTPPSQVTPRPKPVVTDAELDALSRQLRREKVGDSLSVRSTLIALSLDKRLRQPAPAKASRVRRT